MIWLASVISGTCASAHGTAATWAVNELSHSTLLLSMMSTFSSLPFFLFTLPAGALADIASDEELPSASVLSGLQLDICGMIGPALGAFSSPNVLIKKSV
jgi:transmembrane secretion effector